MNGVEQLIGELDQMRIGAGSIECACSRAELREHFTHMTGPWTTRPSSAEPYIASYYPTISDPSLLEIRRERSIELCLEGLRLNDLKRWNCCDLW